VNAFEFIDRVRKSGGSVELIDGKACIRGFPTELEIAVLNRDAIREALFNPGKWPCRLFRSHPTTPTLPCGTCGEDWSLHPPDLRQPYDRVPLLVKARGIVAAAVAEKDSETRV
jgi:hypothetical protein